MHASGHRDHVLGVSWHEGGRMFASCSHDGLVLLWRTDVGSPVMVLKAHESIVYHCQYLPNSNRCVAAAAGRGGDAARPCPSV